MFGLYVSTVGCGEHPAGVDQHPPAEVALGHGGSQRQRGLQGRLPRVLARGALAASIDPLDLPVCDLSSPTGGKAQRLDRGVRWALLWVLSVCRRAGWDLAVLPFHLFPVSFNETPGLLVSIWVSAEVVIPNPVALGILHKHVVILLHEEVGVPVQACVLVDGPAHSAPVGEAVTNIAVIGTYFTESSLELVRTGAPESGSPLLARACATILAGVWSAR